MGDALWMAHYASTRGLRRMDLETGFTEIEHALLRLIGTHPGIDLHALASLVAGETESVGVIVRRLTKSGLVRRSRDPHDRRRGALDLSTAGRALVGMTPYAGHAGGGVFGKLR